jgi:UDP-N-acetylglucosamine--N-acetylmuramyl-(pentapeptide) pyrophosphoryl-undecaprenol N-acetylglucosamine transferase
MMGTLLGKPLVLHEQNSVAGLANQVLASIADRVFTAFPNVMKKAQWVGNPLRAPFLNQPVPEQRFAERRGPLRLLVVGGSLGAKALNDTVPQALALLPQDERPVVLHQSGEKQIEALRANYEAAGVQAELTAFIDDTAQAFAEADLIVCRAGASTVTEIAAVGAAALFVPFPSAVDDHQTRNARFLVDAGAAWLVPQPEFTPQALAHTLRTVQREQLQEMAVKARQMQKTDAVAAMVAACEQLSKVKTA